MTSPRQTNTPERGGDEVDAFSRKARRLLKSFNRAGVAKAAVGDWASAYSIAS